MRVVVVGSRIAGLAGTVDLRRVGIDVTIHERASELTEVGAGISLWADALRARATKEPGRRFGRGRFRWMSRGFG